MIGLNLKQITNDGRTKVWKISQQKILLTFGTSRKAQLISIDNDVEPYEFVLEFKNNNWHLISFAINENDADRIVTNESTFRLPNSVIQFEVLEKKSFILNQINNLKLKGNIRKNLVVVTKDDRIINTQLHDKSKPYSFYSDGRFNKLNLIFNEEWNEINLNGFVIKSKEILATDSNELGSLHFRNAIDSGSKKSIYVTLSVTAFIISLSAFAPQTNTDLMKLPAKTVSTNFTVKTEMKKNKQTPASSAKSVIQTTSPQNAGGGKSTAQLKAAIGIRISQLLGKVSATEARTKNILVASKGIKAGQENSGRSLAAIGKIESSGRNWTGESNVKGTGVGTAGVGGGNGTKGLGSGLGQGKTGSGGVGLIEEESEITGGLDREIIAQYIKTQLGQILYCYERQLSASPDLFGKIAVRFTIAGSGLVETQTINDTTLKNRSVENCILNKISKWKFPEPKGGTKVLVTYPFLFKSTN